MQGGALTVHITSGAGDKAYMKPTVADWYK